MYFDLIARVDFTTLYFSSSLTYEQGEAIRNKLLTFKYVTTVWMDHTCCVLAELDTHRSEVATRRVNDLMGKIERLFRRYTKR